jgi:hypothetical protein
MQAEAQQGESAGEAGAAARADAGAANAVPKLLPVVDCSNVLANAAVHGDEYDW